MDPLISALDIPQEIIDTIIDELHDEEEALKSCTMVSRSLYLPSRSKLFSSIELDTIEKGDRLKELLISNPNIPPLVRKLSITNLCIPYDDGVTAERFNQIMEWYRSNSSLPTIFNALSDLQWLSWGRTKQIYLSWDSDLSNDAREAFMDRIRSPCLTTLNICGLRGVPASIFPMASYVKRLRLAHATIHQFSPDSEFVLTHVEELALDKAFMVTKLKNVRLPKLRRLLFWKSSNIAQQIIYGLESSLERIRWHSPSFNTHNITLAGIHNLKFLTFVVTLMDCYGWKWEVSHIIRHLKDPSVTKSLKQLNVGIKARQDTFRFHWGTLFLSNTWQEFDAILSSIPTLEQVDICIDFGDLPRNTASILVLGAQEHLPLSIERGIVFVREGDVDHLEEDIWAGSCGMRSERFRKEIVAVCSMQGIPYRCIYLSLWRKGWFIIRLALMS